MRVRGTGRGLRTLSRVALIGIIGGGAAACSSDASRLSNPFSNPFSSEPAATGSLPEGGLKPAPAIRTGRIQSEALGAPGAAPRPAATAIPAPTPAAAPATRVASTGTPGWSAQGGTQITVSKNDSLNQMSNRFGVPASAILSANGLSNASQITPGRQIVIPVYNASGLNPAAAPMTARPARAAEEKREDARQVEAKVASKREEAKEAAKREEAKREESKRAAAEKEADRKEALARDTAARKAAEEKSRKEASPKEADKKKHVRPGQVAKADEKKADPKADAKAKAEAKAQEAKAEAKAAAKAEATQKLAEAKAAKEAAQKAAAAEKPEKVAAKEAPKPVAAAAPAKPEPAATGSVADASPSESFRWPAKGRVISGYGTSGNEGINIAVPEGTPVKAAEEGTVAYAGSDVKGYGKLVLVRHANGFVSAYAHNGEIDVKPGDKVKRGQTIAKSGASGNVTSPQLHFEIRKGGSPVDPMSQLASN
ncbi:peptidoglycan DD-metalloendopeptidase family protein [Methylobacterium pseudosasicola]|uniref:Murein DD-endopeptidase MepM and murein hydrolase activator NlpD, contain LysM domain n=1 Tax=Methylobacterium pseudosasicola TaxID=582667 RepID=A0A1I4IKE8_9HYPH|nr:peptidoglycan DD-metalloendopeptidase family protein [Methylobacterium pseudosasicola]SFL54281.1 Murein DD-endopeptidase MepM and murein hydrolase activator NlpD, contain LysM domain [Methylobacterium pseudosasicola]